MGLALIVFGVAMVSPCSAEEQSTVAEEPNDGARSVLDPVQVAPQWVVLRPSPRVQDVIRRPDGVALVRTLGWPGVTYQLEASDDLMKWQPVGEPQMGGGRWLTIEDPEAVDKPQRFYRFELSACMAPNK